MDVKNAYQYEQLDEDESAFRLMRLVSGSFNDPLEGELFISWLGGDAGGIEYEALSYTWGSTVLTAKILIDGRELGITENLDMALRHLRFENRDRYVWVDAVCIDQKNDRERGHQVQNMRNIYKNAEQTIIWLGEATYETDALMESLCNIQRNSTAASGDWRSLASIWLQGRGIISQQGHPRNDDPIMQLYCDGLHNLITRPWFRRIWVLQEVASARRASVVCGTKLVSAKVFAAIPKILGITPEPRCQAVLDVMPGFTRKESWWSHKRDLLTLLQKFQHSESTDPRDKIFALLGLSSDPTCMHTLRPDYTKNLQGVWTDTIQYLISRVLGQDIPDLALDMERESVLSEFDYVVFETIRTKLKEKDERSALSLLKPSLGDPNKEHLQDELVDQIVECGCANVFKTLLSEPKLSRVIRSRHSFGYYLIISAEKGFVDMAKLLLTYPEVEINCRNSNGQTPLAIAVELGHMEVVKVLLDRPGCAVNVYNRKGFSPLLYALFNLYQSLALEEDARHLSDKDISSPESSERLSLSADNKWLSILRLLLEHAQLQEQALHNKKQGWSELDEAIAMLMRDYDRSGTLVDIRDEIRMLVPGNRSQEISDWQHRLLEIICRSLGKS